MVYLWPPSLSACFLKAEPPLTNLTDRLLSELVFLSSDSLFFLTGTAYFVFGVIEFEGVHFRHLISS